MDGEGSCDLPMLRYELNHGNHPILAHAVSYSFATLQNVFPAARSMFSLPRVLQALTLTFNGSTSIALFRLLTISHVRFSISFSFFYSK